MARYDNDRRNMKHAYGRYSGSDQGDDRQRAERRDHGVYGYPPGEGPGYEREEPGDHYYDPDHVYRSRDRYNSGYGGGSYGRREYFRHGADQPYSNRPYPGAYDRDDGLRERDREAWRNPSSWYGGDGSASHESASHRGRGPKGYLRSDDRIREDICDMLTDDPHVDASDIEVGVKNGEVTLNGKIAGRGARRHVEELAERASGVKHVQNNLRVSAAATVSDKSATPLFQRTGSD